MRTGRYAAAFAVSWLALVYIKNGTAPKLINDAARGAKDVVSGFKGAAGLA